MPPLRRRNRFRQRHQRRAGADDTAGAADPECQRPAGRFPASGRAELRLPLPAPIYAEIPGDLGESCDERRARRAEGDFIESGARLSQIGCRFPPPADKVQRRSATDRFAQNAIFFFNEAMIQAGHAASDYGFRLVPSFTLLPAYEGGGSRGVCFWGRGLTCQVNHVVVAWSRPRSNAVALRFAGLAILIRSRRAASAKAGRRVATVPGGPVYEAIVLDARNRSSAARRAQSRRGHLPGVADQRRKMMTLYLTFEALNQGHG